jgi:hypothetical protein
MRLRFAAQTLRRLLDHVLAYAAAHLRSDIFERFGEIGILHAADLVVKTHVQLCPRNAGKSSPGCGSASSNCRSSAGGSAGFLPR